MIADQLPARIGAPFVVVTGGKGGVGKTTLATNLGVRLARRGGRVLVADLDLGLANVNVLLGLSPQHTLEDALGGRCSARDCVVAGPGGVHVLPAGSGTAAMGRPDEERRRWILSALDELSEDYDVIVGDGAAGIGPDALGFATLAELVLVVTNPDPAALTDAYGLIKALDTFSQEEATEVPTPELFLNQVAGIHEAERVARSLRGVCENYLARSPRMAGWMPRTGGVALAGRRQRPFADASRSSLELSCLDGLVARIERRFSLREAPLKAQAQGVR